MRCEEKISRSEAVQCILGAGHTEPHKVVFAWGGYRWYTEKELIALKERPAVCAEYLEV